MSSRPQSKMGWMINGYRFPEKYLRLNGCCSTHSKGREAWRGGTFPPAPLCAIARSPFERSQVECFAYGHSNHQPSQEERPLLPGLPGRRWKAAGRMGAAPRKRPWPRRTGCRSSSPAGLPVTASGRSGCSAPRRMRRAARGSHRKRSKTPNSLPHSGSENSKSHQGGETVL